MSLDGIMMGLSVFGAGLQIDQQSNIIKLGEILPKDIQIPAKYKAQFVDHMTAYNRLQDFKTFLQKQMNIQFTEQKQQLSKNVTFWDGIPASGVWMLHFLILSEPLDQSAVQIIIDEANKRNIVYPVVF